MKALLSPKILATLCAAAATCRSHGAVNTMNQMTSALVPGKHQLFFEPSGGESQNRIFCGVGVMVDAAGTTDGGLTPQTIGLRMERWWYAFDFTLEPVTNGTVDPQKFTQVDFRFGEARGKLFIRDIRLIEKESQPTHVLTLVRGPLAQQHYGARNLGSNEQAVKTFVRISGVDPEGNAVRYEPTALSLDKESSWGWVAGRRLRSW